MTDSNHPPWLPKRTGMDAIPSVDPTTRGRPGWLLERGFTLLELLIAAALLTFAAGALLYHLAFSYRHYQIARDDWKVALELWNEAARWRAEVTPSTLAVPPAGSGNELPLRRIRLQAESAGRKVTWEVLHVHP